MKTSGPAGTVSRVFIFLPHFWPKFATCTAYHNGHQKIKILRKKEKILYTLEVKNNRGEIII
jgi:hypothetical protein